MVRLLVQRVRMKVVKSLHLNIERQHQHRHILPVVEAAVGLITTTVVVVVRVVTLITVAAAVVHHQVVK